MWYVKMYFSGDKEIFEYDASGMQGYPAEHQELPFLESLLSFQELDCEALVPVLARICDHWKRLITENDRQAGTDAMIALGDLASQHIYFKLQKIDKL